MNNLYHIILDATHQNTRNTWRWKTMSKHYLMVESARFAGLKNILRRTPNHTPMHTSAGEFPTKRTLFPDTASCQGHRLISTGSRESKGWLFPQRSESQQRNICWSYAICISQLEHRSKIDITVWYEYIYIWLHMYNWIHSTKHPSWFDVSISLSRANKGTISNKLHLTYGKQKQKDAQRCKSRKWRVIVHLHVWIKNTHWTNWGSMTWHV